MYCGQCRSYIKPYRAKSSNSFATGNEDVNEARPDLPELKGLELSPWCPSCQPATGLCGDCCALPLVDSCLSRAMGERPGKAPLAEVAGDLRDSPLLTGRSRSRGETDLSLPHVRDGWRALPARSHPLSCCHRESLSLSHAPARSYPRGGGERDRGRGRCSGERGGRYIKLPSSSEHGSQE